MPRMALALVTLLLVAGCANLENLERDSIYAGPKYETLAELQGEGCRSVQFLAAADPGRVQENLTGNFVAFEDKGEGEFSLHLLSCEAVGATSNRSVPAAMAMAAVGVAPPDGGPGTEWYLLSILVTEPAVASDLEALGLPVQRVQGLSLQAVQTHPIVEELDASVAWGPWNTTLKGTVVSIETKTWPSDRYWYNTTGGRLRLTLVHETEKLGAVSGRLVTHPGSPFESLMNATEAHGWGRVAQSSMTLKAQPIDGKATFDMSRVPMFGEMVDEGKGG